MLVINGEHPIETVILFDTGADLNWIQDGLVPTKFFENTKEWLKFANGSKLQIDYKLSDLVLENSSLKIKTEFLLIKNMTSQIILRSSFIHQIMPFLVIDEGIVIEKLGEK